MRESGSRGAQETPLKAGPALVSPSPLVGEGQEVCVDVWRWSLCSIAWPGCGDSVAIHQQAL